MMLMNAGREDGTEARLLTIDFSWRERLGEKTSAIFVSKNKAA